MKGPIAKIEAQAKLNLHLRVFQRDASGYHPLETIFHRIELADSIRVTATNGDRSLDVEGIDAGPIESNLAYRAALAFSEASGWPRGFQIEITKRIPVGGGLGGGSADAAAVLRALNSLAECPLRSDVLMDIGATLGADVPFLASDHVMALAWGHGERMLALPPLPQRDVMLVDPGISVSTAAAYAWLDEDRARGIGAPDVKRPQTRSMDLAQLSSWGSIADLSENDFIDPVTRRHSPVGDLLLALHETGTFLPSMTGSGSTLFGIYDKWPDTQRVSAFRGARITNTQTATSVVDPVRVE